MVGRKGGNSNAGSSPTSIHRILGIDPDQVRAELAAQGKTPDDVARARADIGRKVAEAFPDVGSAEFSFELASREGLEFAPADPDALDAARSQGATAQALALTTPDSGPRQMGGRQDGSLRRHGSPSLTLPSSRSTWSFSIPSPRPNMAM